MKALSLRQPWAHAVLHLGKDVENRRWSTRYRGWLLLHAAAGMTSSEFRDASAWIAEEMSFGIGDQVRFEDDFKARGARGGIVGIARVTDIIPRCSGCTLPADLKLGGCGHEHRPWHMPDQFGWLLADVRPLPFIPYKGCLGLFDVDTTAHPHGPQLRAAIERACSDLRSEPAHAHP